MNFHGEHGTLQNGHALQTLASDEETATDSFDSSAKSFTSSYTAVEENGESKLLHFTSDDEDEG